MIRLLGILDDLPNFSGARVRAIAPSSPSVHRTTKNARARVCSGRISHDGFSERCSEDLEWSTCGENVAFNRGFPGGAMGAAERAMQGWEDSPGHYQNIITDSRDLGGVGYHLCDDGRYYFTGFFGNP